MKQLTSIYNSLNCFNSRNNTERNVLSIQKEFKHIEFSQRKENDPFKQIISQIQKEEIKNEQQNERKHLKMFSDETHSEIIDILLEKKKDRKKEKETITTEILRSNLTSFSDFPKERYQKQFLYENFLQKDIHSFNMNINNNQINKLKQFITFNHSVDCHQYSTQGIRENISHLNEYFTKQSTDLNIHSISLMDCLSVIDQK